MPAPCLVGEVSGHPLLPGTGRPIATSDLWALAPDAGMGKDALALVPPRQADLGTDADQ